MEFPYGNSRYPSGACLRTRAAALTKQLLPGQVPDPYFVRTDDTRQYVRGKLPYIRRHRYPITLGSLCTYLTSPFFQSQTESWGSEASTEALLVPSAASPSTYKFRLLRVWGFGSTLMIMHLGFPTHSQAPADIPCWRRCGSEI